MTMQPHDPADRSETSAIAELSRPTLGSEEIILDAPMSFTGITKRTRRFSSRHPRARWWSKTLATTGLVLWLTLAYIVIFCWYALLCTVFLVPFVAYRLIRRSQRRDEQRRRQHAELLAGTRRAS